MNPMKTTGMEGKMMTDTKTAQANADVTDRLEQGGFFEPLHCDLYGKVTDVRFWQSNKV